MHIKAIHKASCHCGGVEFELTLPNGLEDPRRCNCSICRMRGAIAASVALEGLKVTKGANLLTLYQGNLPLWLLALATIFVFTAPIFCGMYVLNKYKETFK